VRYSTTTVLARRWHDETVIHLTAQKDVEGFDVDRAKCPLLELIRCTHVDVSLGPPVVITIPGHDPDELAPGV
jgi:hypothetical protein